MLRFAILGLLFVVGLRSRLPDPIRSVATERNRPKLERFKTHYDAEFAALANPQKREDWLSKQFEAQSRARQRQIYEWNEKHLPAKEQARRDMSLFRSLLFLYSKPFSVERKTSIADTFRGRPTSGAPALFNIKKNEQLHASPPPIAVGGTK